MPTRLSRYANGVMEAAWLAAVILVPLFFNIYSSRIFEPDKIALLRSLALLSLAAWLVKLVEERGVHWDQLRPPPEQSNLLAFLKIPLVAPALAMGLVYLLATIFSVTPAVSLWGSYQRLQGTYTTLSYLVIFAALAANLRRREQVERLITAIILVSLPVGLYGILQRFKLDPVPWGGDTYSRIAANMGNSIFVGAYLIMVFPLTLGRILITFRAILQEEEHLALYMLRATLYIFVAAIQVIALYLSGSRGPALGWGAGIFFTVLILSFFWHKRWFTFAWAGLAAIGMALILIFNLQSSTLAALRQLPGIGRFGQLLDPESNTALVRKYIWQGTVKLVSLHAPLQYPDGSLDRFNFLRPLIGYGPESMYVAYNPFYIPELAHVEKRNASPDRSHNETWDALVITGLLGLAAYLAVFTAAFYYGLSWLGLVPDRKRRLTFFLLYGGAGLLGALGFSLVVGREYAGVGLPTGMVVGMVVYLVVAAATIRDYAAPRNTGEFLRAITLIVLLAAILGHFIEINFGIAIAVTRTYFWTYSALLLLVGYVLPRYGAYGADETLLIQPGTDAGAAAPAQTSRKKRKAARGRVSPGDGERWEWLRQGWVVAYPMALILVTLGYTYIANLPDVTSAGALLWGSLTRLRLPSQGTSYALVVMLLLVWLLGSLLSWSENPAAGQARHPWRVFLAGLGLSALAALVFWLWHAGALAVLARSVATNQQQVLDQVRRYEGLLTNYYLFTLILVLAAPFGLVASWSSAKQPSLAGGLVGVGALLVVLILAAYSNLRVVQADVAFKLADPFAKQDTWQVAIDIYDRANSLAPSEDYYDLFLGRAFLEYARSLQDAAQRDQVMQTAQDELLAAQKLNPLNTDHTANLARLFSLWAGFTNEQGLKSQRAAQSDEYFSRALALSPSSARLWDEWGLLALNLIGQPEQAKQRFDRAQAIDPGYDWTYALTGDYYARQASLATDDTSRQEALRSAAADYSKALELLPTSDQANMVAYTLALANAYRSLGELQPAISAYQNVLSRASTTDQWRLLETLGRLYLEAGDNPNGLLYFQRAYDQAPDDQKSRLKSQIDQLTAGK